MARTFDERTKAQLVKAIRKVFPDPTPLIGDKWFRPHPKGKPADMEFTGVSRLAKATGVPIRKVAQQILKNVSLDKIPATARIARDYRLLFDRVRTDPGDASGKAGDASVESGDGEE